MIASTCPNSLDRAGDHRVDVGLALDVAHHTEVLDTERVELRAGVGQQVLLPFRDHHARAALAEMQCHSFAHAASGSGDDHNSVADGVHRERIRHAANITAAVRSRPMNLDGRTIVVTGGGSGIGRATANRCAREGARVAVVDRAADNAQAVAREIGDAARAYACDVGDEASVATTIATIGNDLGRVAGVVTAAGIFGGGDMRPAHEVAVDEFLNVLRVNLVGTFIVAKYALPMLIDGGGAIVTIASTAAIRGHGYGSGYTASKGGVDALTRLLAVQYGPHGVRANCICPGGVDTPMTGGVFASEESQARAKQRVPLGRYAQPSDIGDVAVFLLSEDARYLTGQTLPVEGGATIA